MLAVSKTFPADAVREAHAAGQTAFGENYIQEAVEKIEALADLRAGLEWHCIGPMQSNKTRPVAAHFDWVHSIDRLKIAERLAEQRPRGAAAAAGLHAGQRRRRRQQVGRDRRGNTGPGAGCCGLATLAAARADGDPRAGAGFRGAAALFLRAAAVFEEMRGAGLEVDTLSMGMTADLEAAIAAGSTMVRIGTAIFGAR